MLVVRDRTALPPPPERGRVVTIGVFDGVHLGHAAILKETVARARALKAEAAVLTFTTHPRALLSDETPVSICSIEQRLELLQKHGIEFVAALPFDESIRKLTPLSFLTDLIGGRIGGKALVLGHDAHFGKNRKGNADFAREKEWDVTEVPAVMVHDVRASSGQVRTAVLEGRLADAAAFLGRDFNIRGTVVRGDGRGRSIGFGTANLQLHHELKPPRGVYAGYVTLEGVEHPAVTNIGVRPTVGGTAETVEVHVPSWKTELYDRTLDVFVISKLRDERKFKDIDALKSQIARDVDNARAAYLAKQVKFDLV